ncbi:LPXTG cell wall anchor domain-containing protein [Ligilactobacillus ceti]|nr:LPXTG cell wall anchor domain-containing protein [Ligilactobacillus ceti]
MKNKKTYFQIIVSIMLIILGLQPVVSATEAVSVATNQSKTSQVNVVKDQAQPELVPENLQPTSKEEHTKKEKQTQPVEEQSSKKQKNKNEKIIPDNSAKTEKQTQAKDVKPQPAPAPQLLAATNVVKNFAELKQAIQNATKPTTIKLAAGEYRFTETLVISQNITLENTGAVRLLRGSKFHDSFFKVEKELILKAAQGKFEFDSEHHDFTTSRAGDFIYNKGHVVVEGVDFKNSRAVTRGTLEVAPIYATGEKAVVDFKSGSISGSEYEFIVKAWSGTAYMAGGIMLMHGATLNMSGGEIHHNNVGCPYDSAGGVAVYSGSHFNMTGGSIHDNFANAAGAVYVGPITHGHVSEQHKVTDVNKLKHDPIAYFTMDNNATLTNNTGFYYAGAVSVYANAQFIMNNGYITNNKSKGITGGVLATDLYVTDNQPPMGRVSMAEWSKLFPGRFIMNGGHINNNEGVYGGGLYVASNECRIEAGEFKNNLSVNQGGAIYVASVPYVLHIANASVFDNQAVNQPTTRHISNDEMFFIPTYGQTVTSLTKGVGGGIWLCPTGDATFKGTGNLILANNTAETAGDDFYKEENYKNYKVEVTLPKRNLLGQKIKYYLDNVGKRYKPGDKVYADKTDNINVVNKLGFKIILEDGTTEILKTLTTVIIAGNKSCRGGGIGSNGTVVFGNQENIRNVQVLKKWGAKVTPAEQKEIVVDIIGELNQKEWLIEKVTLNKANNWQVKINDLPATVNKHEYKIKVREVTTLKGFKQPEIQKTIVQNTKVPTVLFTILNSKETPKPKEPKLPKNGDTDQMHSVILGIVLLMSSFGLMWTRRKIN